MLKKNKEVTRKMFDDISKNYDFLNHFLSFGMDHYWRKKAIKYLTNSPKKILDIATGTADFAISASKINNVSITGIDISQEMLNIGKEKIRRKNLDNIITLKIGDAESLTFQDKYFDAITAGFGVRNFENLDKGLAEMYRTLNDKGILVVLEPSTPTSFPLKQIYNVYFHHILPFFGKIISKDSKAYRYLPDSVKKFPKGSEFISCLHKAGFINCKHIPLTLGIVDLYVAIK